VFRRDAFDRRPGWYYAVKNIGDWSQAIICSRLGVCAYIDEVMCVYRIHNEGLARNRSAIAVGVLAMFGFMNAWLNFEFAELSRDMTLRYRTEWIVDCKRKALQGLWSLHLPEMFGNLEEAITIRRISAGFHLRRARVLFSRGLLRDAAVESQLELVFHPHCSETRQLLMALLHATEKA